MIPLLAQVIERLSSRSDLFGGRLEVCKGRHDRTAYRLYGYRAMRLDS